MNLLCKGKIKDTKILFIDILSISLNRRNRFHETITKVIENNDHCQHLHSNVLLLTILSDKYRHYLNVVDENNKLNQVQNFRNNKMAVTNVQKTIQNLLNCTSFNGDVEKEKIFCQKIAKDFKDFNSNCVNLTEHMDLFEDYCKATALKDYIEYFNLFEFLVDELMTSSMSSQNIQHKYDFIVLDVTDDGVDLSWRPSLILQQNNDDINMKSFITHSLLLPDYHNTLKEILWECGKICWTIITISFGILLIIIVSVSLLTGIAVR